MKITRRQLFQQVARAVLLARLAPRVATSNAAPAVAPMRAADGWPEVAICRGTDADSGSALLRTALADLGGIQRFVRPGQVVCIKPNATWAYPPGTASSTDPDVLRALILLVQEAGAAKIVVVDHCTLDPGAAECLRVSGIGKVLDEFPDVVKVFGDRFRSPKELFVDVEFPQGVAFKKLAVFKAAVESDVRINMAVPKSHWVTKFTLCLKHLMGYYQLPTALHANLDQGIADIATPSAIFSHLHILEAIRVRYPVPGRQQAGGLGNEITDPQRVKRLNQMVAGTDPVLIDAYGMTEYYGRLPAELPHVQRAYEMGLGEIDVAAALASGRMRIYRAGEPIVVPTPTPTPTITLTPTATPSLIPTATQTPTPTSSPTGPTLTYTPPPTDTPLPTSTCGPTADPALSDSMILPSDAQPASGTAKVVMDARPVLSRALIPAAAIVASIGAVLRRVFGQTQDRRS